MPANMSMLDDAQSFTPFCTNDKGMSPWVMTEEPVAVGRGRIQAHRRVQAIASVLADPAFRGQQAD
jgi:hypothetical protein